MNVTLAVDSLSPTLSGIGRYCWELAQRIPPFVAPDTVHFYRDGAIWDDPSRFLQPPPALRPPRIYQKFGEKRRRAMVARTLRESLVHSPNYFLPPGAEGGIMTVHDLSVFKFPETHPAARLHHFEREFLNSLKRASLVITDTETVRQEVHEFTDFPANRIVSVSLGVDQRYRPMAAQSIAGHLAQWGLLPGGYGLCVATLEPRKRIDNLVVAWSRLPVELKREFPLVLVGARGWLNDDLERLLAKGQSQGWLLYLGFVPEVSLPILYAGARLFAYPSIYEGFGLPLIEAMASGTPVITSDRSCMPEVCGGAAALVPDDDNDGLAAAIISGLRDENWRTKAIAAGLVRAQNFTWSNCASKTYLAYEYANMLR